MANTDMQTESRKEITNHEYKTRQNRHFVRILSLRKDNSTIDTRACRVITKAYGSFRPMLVVNQNHNEFLFLMNN